MAGLGEACSHSCSPICPGSQYANQKEHVLHVLALYLAFSFFPKCHVCPSFEIDFKQKKLSEPSTVKITEMPDSSEEELQSLYRDLAADRPVLLSLIPGFSDDYMPLSEKGVLPKPLTYLYKAEYLDLARPDLLAKCEEIYNTVTVTSEECNCCLSWYRIINATVGS